MKRLMRRPRPGWILYGLHWYLIAVVLTAAWIYLSIAIQHAWIPTDTEGIFSIVAFVCALAALAASIRGVCVTAKTHRLSH